MLWGFRVEIKYLAVHNTHPCMNTRPISPTDHADVSPLHLSIRYAGSRFISYSCLSLRYSASSAGDDAVHLQSRKIKMKAAIANEIKKDVCFYAFFL